MKFIIESTKKIEDEIRLHFDTPIAPMLSRLGVLKSIDELFNSTKIEFKQFIPHKSLVGVEAFIPETRYSIAFLIGKCFSTLSVIKNIADLLEIAIDDSNQWNNWIEKLENDNTYYKSSVLWEYDTKSNKFRSIKPKEELDKQRGLNNDKQRKYNRIKKDTDKNIET